MEGGSAINPPTVQFQHNKTRSSGPRRGRLTMRHPQSGVTYDLETPCYAVPTGRGGVPFLTPDIVIDLFPPQSSILEVSPFAVPESLSSSSGDSDVTAAGVAAHMGLPEYCALMTPRGSVLASSEMPTVIANPARLVEVTSAGRKVLRLPDEYRDVSHRAQAVLTANPTIAPKGLANPFSTSANSPGSRNYECIECADVHVGTFGGTPWDVLRQAKEGTCGSDIYTSDYPIVLAMEGIALVLETSGDRQPHDGPLLHLRDVQHRLDVSPIHYNCKCLTCTQHTRAYLHHLLRAHEMNSTVLLLIHNLHTYGTFFSNWRRAMDTGDEDTFYRSIMRQI